MVTAATINQMYNHSLNRGVSTSDTGNLAKKQEIYKLVSKDNKQLFLTIIGYL
jgi:hypothetical protein